MTRLESERAAVDDAAGKYRIRHDEFLQNARGELERRIGEMKAEVTRVKSTSKATEADREVERLQKRRSP